MKKYKQNIIPSVRTTGITNNIQSLKTYYSSHLQGRSVVNRHLNIRIYFTSLGKGKVSYGGGRYSKKSELIHHLPLLLEIARFNNFGQRKEKDKQNVLGYLNFKVKVIINGNLENVRITAIVRDDGRFYYNHEISIKK